jgi:hypothetical protein
LLTGVATDLFNRVRVIGGEEEEATGLFDRVRVIGGGGVWVYNTSQQYFSYIAVVSLL